MPSGRAHKPTKRLRSMVAVLKAHGETDVNIGLALGISYKTIVKYYQVELKTGLLTFKGKVLGAISEMLLSPDPKTQGIKIFWLKTRLRWQEPPRLLELPSGGPNRVEELTDEELTAIVANRAKRERDRREGGRGKRGRAAVKAEGGEEVSS